MKDRLLAGSLAGLIAGLVLKAWGLLSYYVLHFSKHRFIDFMTTLLMGHTPKNAGDIVVGEALHMIWVTVLGTIFAYLIPLVTSRHHLYRGWLYSITTWMVTLALPVLYKIPETGKTVWQTIVSGLIGASIYGILLAYILNRLDNPAGADGPKVKH